MLCRLSDPAPQPRCYDDVSPALGPWLAWTGCRSTPPENRPLHQNHSRHQHRRCFHPRSWSSRQGKGHGSAPTQMLREDNLGDAQLPPPPPPSPHPARLAAICSTAAPSQLPCLPFISHHYDISSDSLVTTASFVGCQPVHLGHTRSMILGMSAPPLLMPPPTSEQKFLSQVSLRRDTSCLRSRCGSQRSTLV